MGYDLKPFADWRTLQIAKPEKALLDLFYLFPFYNSQQEFLDLRFDEDFMQDDLNLELLKEYTSNFKNHALEKSGITTQNLRFKIQLDLIKNYFPAHLRENVTFQKYMLKEYIQLSILDFLSTTHLTQAKLFLLVAQTSGLPKGSIVFRKIWTSIARIFHVTILWR